MHPLLYFKSLFKAGHPKFAELAYDMTALHDRKNKFYAGGGHPLGNFRRVAAIMSMYPNVRQGDPAVAVIGMVIKQIDSVLWSLNNHRFDDMNVDEHLADIAVYMTILRCMHADLQIETLQCDHAAAPITR